MSDSRKRKEESHQNNVDDDSTLLTTVFPTLRIKQQLYRDPKVARVDTGALEWINTTSALFLQHIMNQIPKTRTAVANNSNGGQKINNIVTLQDIRNVIQQDPTLSFLQSTVEEMKNETDNTLRPYAQAKKKLAVKKSQTHKPTAAASSSSKTGESSVQEAMTIAAETIAGPSTITTQQQIVEDDDDYD